MNNRNPNQEQEKLLGLAIQLAAEVHWHQLDKGGVCYLLHPLAVMQMCAPDRDAMIVAVLHDTIEDATGQHKARVLYSIERSFPPYIKEALEALTHKLRGEETYDDYIERVATNFLARKVKLCDLIHNMDPRRIPAGEIVDKDFERWTKYRKALLRLERGP